MTQYWEQQRERSSTVLLYGMAWATLSLGRQIARLILFPIVGYFLLTSPRAVRASRNALRRLLGREPAWLDVARHFYTYAACAIDRLYFLKDRQGQFHITAERPATVTEIAGSGRGCLLLVAHLGSFESLRALGTAQRRLPLSILLDREQGKKMIGLLERLNPQLAAQLIDASLRGPTLVLKLKEAMQAGRMVCMMADRVRADERALEVQFLGGPVRFPAGPWSIAVALGVPVILGFGLYRGGNRYDLIFELFAERITAARTNRAAELQAHAQRYAQRLELYAQRAPFNWFNFYDYWAEEPAALRKYGRKYGN